MPAQTPAANLVLTGMPGSGKSTVGVLLAKRLGLGFVDTDLLIQQRTGCTLQTIVDNQGYLRLREIEEQVLLDLHIDRHVIATGGSAVYSERAMAHLKDNGTVVFLDIPPGSVISRIGDYSLRGISRRPGQSLEALFEERYHLYNRHADLVVDARPAHDEVVDRLLEMLDAGGLTMFLPPGPR